MKTTILLALATLFMACGNRVAPAETVESEDSGNPSTSSIVDPKNRQDTVFFGYILGQPTKAITNKLIDEGKFFGDIGYRETFTIAKGGVSQKIYVDGYSFYLYIADRKYTALLTLFDTNGQKITLLSNDGNLMSQQIYIHGREKEPIIEALKKQYGAPNTPPEDGYEPFVPYEDIDGFWNISNKAVYLATLGNFMVLVYEDIIAIRNKNNAETTAREVEKKYSQEQSKETQL